MKIKTKLHIIMECLSMSSRELKNFLSIVSGSHANMDRWLSDANGCSAKYRGRIACRIAQEIPGFIEDWFHLTDNTFRDNVRAALKPKEVSGLMSRMLGENGRELDNAIVHERLLRGIYIVSRKHSIDDMLCRELLVIAGIGENGINARLITHKGGLYFGNVYKQGRIMYMYMGRKHRLYGVAGRMFIFYVEPDDSDTPNDEFSGILVRVGTSEGRPVAAPVICTKCMDVEEKIWREIDALFSRQKDDIVSDKHWIRTDSSWLINKVKVDSSMDEKLGAEWGFLTQTLDHPLRMPTVAETRAAMEKWRTQLSAKVRKRKTVGLPPSDRTGGGPVRPDELAR